MMKQENFRVYLRALELEDYKKTLKWRKDDEIWSMVGGPKYFVSAETEKKWIEKTIADVNNIKLAVCLKDNDKLIGIVSITDIDWINKKAQFHKLIGEKDEWGKGYAEEMTILMLKFIFYERGLNRIYAYQLDSNIGSIKVNLKCGFKKEGLMRQSIFKNGRFHDQVIMSVLREDFIEIEKKRNSQCLNQ